MGTFSFQYAIVLSFSLVLGYAQTINNHLEKIGKTYGQCDHCYALACPRARFSHPSLTKKNILVFENLLAPLEGAANELLVSNLLGKIADDN